MQVSPLTIDTFLHHQVHRLALCFPQFFGSSGNLAPGGRISWKGGPHLGPLAGGEEGAVGSHWLKDGWPAFAVAGFLGIMDLARPHLGPLPRGEERGADTHWLKDGWPAFAVAGFLRFEGSTESRPTGCQAFRPSGIKGMWRRRMAVASKMALATAGPMLMMGVSPAPAEAISLLSMRIISILGESVKWGTR